MAGQRAANRNKQVTEDNLTLRIPEDFVSQELHDTCIDLFCGCGGFTLGMLRAGFRVLAAIDNDPVAIATLKSNLVDRRTPNLVPVMQVHNRDITQLDPSELAASIGRSQVGVIVGGPPCQGFSTARQVDGSNHGVRLKADPRRYLYRDFLRFVEYFQPLIFVMENVLGIRTASGGEYFTRVQSEARVLGRGDGRPGYRVHSQVEDASDLGVPQKRRRQLIIGVRNDLSGYFNPKLHPAPRARQNTTLGDAIGDLPSLRAGAGESERDYDKTLRMKHVAAGRATARNYLTKVLEVSLADSLTNHVARPHSARDLRDFRRLKEGESSAAAMRDRGVVFEFPYNKLHFKDRYTRQHADRACSTIVAHLSKDGLMFIHPKQNRSLTPREAARVQSFPDWFRFPDARTLSFRLIGNAVPPLVAEAIGLAVKQCLARETIGKCMQERVSRSKLIHRPHNRGAVHCNHSHLLRSEAVQILQRLAGMSRGELRELSPAEFLRGWRALLDLLPDLHPENARDHGNEVSTVIPSGGSSSVFERTLARRYVRSGWPVALEMVGKEAWRRHSTREISDGEFYCNEDELAGVYAQP